MAKLSRRTALQLVAGGASIALASACAPTVPTAPAPAATTPPQPLTPPTAAPAAATSAPAAAASVPTATVVPAAKPGPQVKTGGTLRHAQTADVASLDPHLSTSASADTVYVVFDRLTAYDVDRRPQPMLAESWDINSDFTAFKLNLRKGVQFHSGRELTADDVKYSLLRPRDPAVGSSLLGGISAWFNSIEATDKHTIELRSDAPRPGFFDGLENFNIVDRPSLEGPEAKSHVVGTGPFQMVEWVSGDHFSLAKNPNYWMSGRPHLDGITVNIRNQQSMAVQLESGGLDSAKNLAIDDFVRLKDDPNFQAHIHPNGGSFFSLGMNAGTPPLDDKRVRQAMNYAIDRNRFAQTAFRGLAAPMSLPWSQSSPAYDAVKNAAYPYDLDKARSLLREAGVSGFETDLLVIGVAMPQLVDFGQIFQASLAQLGVKLNIKNLQQSVWLDVVINKKPEYTGFWGSNDGPGNVSPGYLFSLSPGWRTVNNHSAFQSEEWTAFVDAVLSETDPTKQKALYAQVNDYILDQSFTAPISANPVTITLNKKVQGIGYFLRGGSVSFTNMWLDS
jgi:peptide/nickel transport system substrate-binding protein